MLGLGSALSRSGKAGPTIFRDGLVLKHDYNRSSVQPCSTGAVFLDGTDDYVNTGSTFQSTFRDSFSICTWVKPVDGQESEVTILGTLSTNGEDGVRIDILAGGEVRFVFEGDDDESYRTTSSNVFSNGVNDWTHIACTATKVGSGSDATTLTLYINGVAVASTLTAATTAANHALYTSDINLTLGCRLYSTTPGRFFDGYMCNTGIWGAALTQAQVKSIMLKDYASLSAGEKTNLVSWWNLDSTVEDLGTVVYDNHGGGLGTELFTNEDFSSDSDWTRGTGWTIANGVASHNASLGAGDLTQNLLLTSGKYYKITIEITATDTDELYFATDVGDYVQVTGSPIGVHSHVFIADEYTHSVGVRGSTNWDGSIDNVSVKQVNGNTGILS